MLSSLIDGFTSTPATLLGAYPSLPLLGGVRHALTSALAAAVKVGGAECNRRVNGCPTGHGYLDLCDGSPHPLGSLACAAAPTPCSPIKCACFFAFTTMAGHRRIAWAGGG